MEKTSEFEDKKHARQMHRTVSANMASDQYGVQSLAGL